MNNRKQRAKSPSKIGAGPVPQRAPKRNYFANLMATEEGRALRRYWSTKPRKNAGRPKGVPDGYTKAEIEPIRKQAKKEAEQVVQKAEQVVQKVEQADKPISEEEKRALAAAKHWKKVKSGLIKKIVQTGGEISLGDLHDFSERRYLVGHQKFSQMMEELVDEELVVYSYEDRMVSLGEKALE